ncbi:MAG: DUF3052 family protein [Deltaproteobacteria bacterium]|nr:DUF3052 family protein [Deltaproteobacteria bacterium]
MPGYSGTPLPQKLGIKAGQRVALLGAEADFDLALAPLPDDVRLVRRLGGAAKLDVIVLFAVDCAALEKSLMKAAAQLSENGGLWISWLKKSSGRPTDLTEMEVRRAGLELGLVDNKVCAVTEAWSGLRFAKRLRDRTRPRAGAARGRATGR